MATRLDRLLLLLDTGTTSASRKAAAQQIGEIQKHHPQDLHNLLARIHVLLHNESWETRTAAAEAIKYIAQNVTQWDPKPAIKSESGEMDVDKAAPDYQLSFVNFNILRIIENGSGLFGSGGSEYEDNDKLTVQQRLEKHQKTVNGILDVGSKYAKLEFDADILKSDTLATEELQRKRKAEDSEKESKRLKAAQEIQEELAGLSARERNKRKRMKRLKSSGPQEKKLEEKAKAGPQKVGGNVGGGAGPDRQKSKTVITEQQSEDKIMMESFVDKKADLEMVDWPFESFCEELCCDLFASTWEVRHGAGAALREIILAHGNGAGKSSTDTEEKQNFNHLKWLEDVGIRLLCVFALDRLGDFASDQVVAPVRETCAQALGALFKYMSAQLVEHVLHVLLELLTRPLWEVRYGGVLGLKYIVAVRKDLAESLLPRVLPALLICLRDSEDDVRSVAAEALLPIVPQIVKLSSGTLPELLNIVWEMLLDLDEITASTVHVMALLGKLISFPEVTQINEKSTGKTLSQLMPRLTAFFWHSNKHVRLASLKALETIIRADDNVTWLEVIAVEMFQKVFQCFLINFDKQVYESARSVWKQMLESLTKLGDGVSIYSKTVDLVPIWFRLLSVPNSSSFNTKDLIGGLLDNSVKKGKKKETTGERAAPIEGPGLPHDRDACLQIRLAGCDALATLISYWSPDKWTDLTAVAVEYITSLSCCKRLLISLFLCDLYASSEGKYVLPDAIVTKIHELLTSKFEPFYEEMEPLRVQMREDVGDIMHSFQKRGLKEQAFVEIADYRTYNEAMAQHFLNEVYPKWWVGCHANVESSKWQIVDSQRLRLEGNIKRILVESASENVSILSSVAGLVVLSGKMLPKLNPCIQPLMKSLRTESNPQLQERSGMWLAKLLKMCIDRTPSPNARIVKNLHGYNCANSKVTPMIAAELNEQKRLSGIWSLEKELEKANLMAKKGRYPPKVGEESEELKTQRIQSRGGFHGLKGICNTFGNDLMVSLPATWTAVLDPLQTSLASPNPDDIEIAQSAVNSLQSLITLLPLLHPDLFQIGIDCCSLILNGLKHPYKAVRFMSAQSLAVLCTLGKDKLFPFLIRDLLPMAKHHDNIMRQGCIEALHVVITSLQFDIVPYIAFFVLPILGRMSDQDHDVRRLAAHSFATLVKLMPLEAGAEVPKGLDADLLAIRERERKFVQQLLDNSQMEDTKVPDVVRADLRSYQQEGINWMSFLKRYNLHGVLGDDMGLGKTLQSICIMGCTLDETDDRTGAALPHIVICPSTLIGHWFYEIQKFAPGMKTISYAGSPNERMGKRKKLAQYNVIISSYEIIRKDIEFLSTLQFSYCILDEGHIIKNSKNKLSASIKSLKANHRLILSGTPIQNNVLELWSLFDFLMPGFLGTERQFNEAYEKPIMLNKGTKVSAKEQEAGILALESLHRQVLPFILRRNKEDVLQDLPPKIIQDYYCQLSPLQARLYDTFSQSNMKQEIEMETHNIAAMEEKTKGNTKGGAMHIFQALQYLRKLCSHPKLVLSDKHPAMKAIKREKTDINDIEHSPKLAALRQLLHDCGIGVQSEKEEEFSSMTNHRVLLFCQMKSMLDIIENDFLAVHMPGVTYLRLDGGVPNAKRYELVHKFNSDPTIDLLLLTTHVGGLGLNLTGADTVVFMEHDWNPMKDLQAMDRAHRIGQKKVVNVYRFITRNTLEEKIMGLQKFKMNIANTVVTTENTSLKSMDTSQLLDLFDSSEKPKEKKKEESTGKVSAKEIVEQLGELWDESQYEEEYNLDTFLNSL